MLLSISLTSGLRDSRVLISASALNLLCYVIPTEDYEENLIQRVGKTSILIAFAGNVDTVL